MLPTLRRQLDNPFTMLREFDRAVNRLWDENTPTNVGAGTFAVDIREVDDTLVVDAELPGYTKEQIDINVEQGVLTIEANRSDHNETAESAEVKPSRHHLVERTTHVTRRFSLPSAYDTSSVDASFDNGLLTLRLPKREEVKPRKIEVK